MSSQVTSENSKKGIILNLILISVCIESTAFLTVFLGRSKYILPFMLIAIVSLVILLFKVGRMTSRNQEQLYSWTPGYFLNPYKNLSLKTYLKTWLISRPFLIIFAFGFWFSSHMQNLLSLSALHIIIPIIPVTITTANVLLAVYILSDFILFLFSRFNGLVLTILKYIFAIIVMLPIYFYVSFTGLITLMKFAFDYYINSATALLLNDIQPMPLLIGAIIIILALWAVTLWAITTSRDSACHPNSHFS